MKMNDLSKKLTIERFTELVDTSPLSRKEIEEKTGIGYHYMTWMRNEKFHHKVTGRPLSWMQSIVNSGESLLSWTDKNQPFKINNQDRPITEVKIEGKLSGQDLHLLPERKNIEIETKCKTETTGNEMNLVINISLRINGREIKL